MIRMVLYCFVALAGLSAKAEWTDTELPYQEGPYAPSWESLTSQCQTPEWFKDAKFGVWAHWGIQCVPETGDWCGMFLYKPEAKREWWIERGNKCYDFHVEHYGHPSEIGLKDYIPGFTAAKWDPDALMKLYKRAGARYFVAMANHHDNFDNWNSKYQPWNSVNMGPKKDLVKGWAEAARKQDLKFGVSVHAARTWTWIQPVFGSDRDGPKKGIPYDGHMTKADGKGKWWEGYDPADLYTPPHKADEPESQEYVDKFFLRTQDLVDQCRPDLLYFDDWQSPLGGTGLRIYAHYYNSSLQWHDGRMEVVVNSKHNDEKTRKGVVEDVERGAKAGIYPTSWQTDTCVGGWHYNIDFVTGERDYKTPEHVISMLVDIVSKNGNLLLSIPLKADGTPDEYCLRFLEEMADWMEVNSEGIYGTRPWRVFGEGPTNTAGGHVNEAALAYTDQDFRFTAKGDTLYVFAMKIPEGDLLVKSLAEDSQKISSVELLGRDEAIEWQQTGSGLIINELKSYPSKHIACFRIR